MTHDAMRSHLIGFGGSQHEAGADHVRNETRNLSEFVFGLCIGLSGCSGRATESDALQQHGPMPRWPELSDRISRLEILPVRILQFRCRLLAARRPVHQRYLPASRRRRRRRRKRDWSIGAGRPMRPANIGGRRGQEHRLSARAAVQLRILSATAIAGVPPGLTRWSMLTCRPRGMSPKPAPQYGVALALLDDPPVRPALHCFVASRAPWFDITDDLPQYPEYPPV